MSEYYDGKYGPAVNNQQPAVSDDHIIAAGFYIEDDGGVKNVYCPCGQCFGKFKDVTWGHGASGLLFLGGRRLDIPSPSRMIEIKAARRILVEADLQNTTQKAQN